jgi:ribosomal protein L40E
MMVGIDEAVEWLEAKTFKADDMPNRIINRLRYVQAKDEGVKPKFHKGMYGKKFDSWTCGNCGAATLDGVGDNYCRKCGYKILWDSTRCLTK